MRNYQAGVAIVVALALSGCASATRGTSEQISMASTPSGAIATVNGTEGPLACTTPCVVQVPRSADINVSFAMEGYEPKVVALQKEVASGGAAGFAGNLLLGGVVGMAVDAGTGAAMDHKPNPVIVTLEPVRPVAPPLVARRSKPRRPPPATM